MRRVLYNNCSVLTFRTSQPATGSQPSQTSKSPFVPPWAQANGEKAAEARESASTPPSSDSSDSNEDDGGNDSQEEMFDDPSNAQAKSSGAFPAGREDIFLRIRTGADSETY